MSKDVLASLLNPFNIFTPPASAMTIALRQGMGQTDATVPVTSPVSDPSAVIPAADGSSPQPTEAAAAPASDSDDTNFFSITKTPTATDPSQWKFNLGAPIPRNKVLDTATGLLAIVSPGVAFYHGYRKNHGSVGWGLAWAIAGRLAPVLTPALALAQGLGQPEK
jgi:hypothetical protein